MEKLTVNKSVVKSLFWHGAFIWLIGLLIIIPHFKEIVPVASGIGISDTKISNALYFAWRLPLTYLVFSLIHTKWSVVIPAVWYYSAFAIRTLMVVLLFSKGQFVNGTGYLLHTLVFGAVVYVFSLITLRIIHNNMFIQSEHYLVRWFGALKMSLRELWQPLLGSYVLYLLVSLFAG